MEERGGEQKKSRGDGRMLGKAAGSKGRLQEERGSIRDARRGVRK